MSLDIVTIPCLSDNYIYLLHDGASGVTALVDAPVSDPVLEALASHRWGLDLILLTHHHEDHIDAADDLRRATGAKLVGAKADAHRLPALDIAVEEGDTVAVGSQTGHVLSVPGHTTGHIRRTFTPRRTCRSKRPPARACDAGASAAVADRRTRRGQGDEGLRRRSRRTAHRRWSTSSTRICRRW
jgi:hydroxyacylglutathione hydrolase